ncbi:MAG TPA: hypothetical protein VIH17_12620 [Candidatus Acidoferrales bacterium]
MFQRFAAGSAIASMAIALAALVVLLIPILSFQSIYPLPVIWCMVPLVWGLWAMIAPKAWVPQRLPLWGAILGLIAGVFGAFVLNLPSQFAGQTVSALLRGLGVLIAVVLYYLLWMLVRAAYRLLAALPPAG